MAIWRRGVVVRRTCGGKRVKKQAAESRHGRSMERKLRRLQRLLPGEGGAGQTVDTEALFQKVTVYIFLLESRVKLLKNVYSLFGQDD